MARIKINNELFLGAAELNHLIDFLDTDGFRSFLLDNSVKFGLIKKDIDSTFSNALVQNGSPIKTMQHNEIRAIDKNGKLIYKPATNSIVVPDDSHFYWVKIKYKESSDEIGLVSIDVNGNLTGSGTTFLSSLRGQPNFPSTVRFTNGIGNTSIYEVLEVIDDQNAILSGSFSAESNLKLSVVGTFTPGSVQTSPQQDIFQYDSCTLTLVQETVLNTPPSLLDGEEFLIARVKVVGNDVISQDVRTSIWQTKTDFFSNFVMDASNILAGVEQIKYNGALTPRDKNIVYLNWAFRTSNYTIDAATRKITINSGLGGRFKDTSYFTSGDFDGWRLYTVNGKFARISSSSKSGSQINLILDTLDITNYSTDRGLTFISQELLVTPDAEEIEFQFTTHPSDNTEIPEQKFNFKINQSYGKAEVIVYKASGATYNVKYRYKHIDSYSAQYVLLTDSVGFYNENQFDANGTIVGSPVRTPYTANANNGFIPVTLSTGSYSNFIAKIDLGDIKGVHETDLVASIQVTTLTVGSSLQYQHFSDFSPISLTQDLFINLKLLDVNSNAVKNGASFYIHIDRPINLDGKVLKIVSNYIGGVYTELANVTQRYCDLIASSPDGLFYIATYSSGIGNWVIKCVDNLPPVAKKIFKASGTGISVSAATMTDLTGLTITTPDDGVTRNYMMFFKGVITPSSAAATSGCNIQFYNVTDSVAYDFTAGGKSSNTVDVNTPDMSLLDYQSIGPNKTITIQGDIGGTANAPTLKYAQMILQEV